MDGNSNSKYNPILFSNNSSVSVCLFSDHAKKKKNIEKVSIITSSAHYTFQKSSAKEYLSNL